MIASKFASSRIFIILPTGPPLFIKADSTIAIPLISFILRHSVKTVRSLAMPLSVIADSGYSLTNF